LIIVIVTSLSSHSVVSVGDSRLEPPPAAASATSCAIVVELGVSDSPDAWESVPVLMSQRSDPQAPPFLV
jgi:hypothetical protein